MNFFTKLLILLFVFVGLYGIESAMSQDWSYVYKQQAEFDAKSPKEQLLLVNKIGTTKDESWKRAFFYREAHVAAYELLHNFNNSLKRDQVERCCAEDARKFYYDALRACGLSFTEAKEKSRQLITD